MTCVFGLCLVAGIIFSRLDDTGEAKSRQCVCALPEQRLGQLMIYYLAPPRLPTITDRLQIHNGELQLVAAGVKTMSASGDYKALWNA